MLNKKEIEFLKAFDDDICITKDQNGRVFMSKDRPVLDETLGEWNKADFIELEKDYFVDLSWKRTYFSKQLLAEAGQ